eukprot:657213-Amphidinium_carterae.1
MEGARRGRNPTSPPTTQVPRRPDPAATASDEFTVVGPGGRPKRRAQSPLLDCQRATMYRALSPSAEENMEQQHLAPGWTGRLGRLCLHKP